MVAGVEIVTNVEHEGATERLGALFTQVGEVTRLPVADVVARLRQPVRIEVQGRPGVGRATVAEALSARGVEVVTGEAPEALVVVVAETLKAEDRRLLASAAVPTLIVLTKADVIGSGPGGPLAVARRRADELVARTGLPVVVLVGLLATVTRLDDELVDALRAMVVEPADLASVDAFVTAPHPVERAVRERLLDRLDRFGVAHALLALAKGAEPGTVVERLHELSNVAAVLDALEGVAAPVHYRRVRRAVIEMRCLAVEYDEPSVLDELASDHVIGAVMEAARDVVEAAGLVVDRTDTAAAHARRAVHWTRYARGPVDALHRACATDIARGSLRLADRA